MLAPPFMDHWMTSELGLMRTNCRTHVRHGVKHCSSGNGLRQMIQGCVVPQDTAHARHTLWRLSRIVHEVVADAGGSCHRDMQCLTHHEWYHTCLLVCFLKLTDHQRDRSQPPSAVAGPLKRTSGGVPTPNPQDHAQRDAFTYQSGGDLGCSLVDVYLEGNARKPPW
jgi:hypothetical protein